MANTFMLLTSTTLSTSTASVTFSNIPQTYTDLIIKGSARTDQASNFSNIFWYVNGVNTGTNYNDVYMRLTSTTVGGSSDTSQATNYAGLVNGNSSTANYYGPLEIYIPNYAGSTYQKPSLISAGSDNTSANMYFMQLGTYTNATAAISSITLAPTGYNFLANSKFELYGITHL